LRFIVYNKKIIENPERGVLGGCCMDDKFWIIFIICLIVSITPISASGLGELSREMKEDNIQMDKSVQGIIQHGYNIKDYGYTIVGCIVNTLYCLCFIVANSWKWWNWVMCGIVSAKLA